MNKIKLAEDGKEGSTDRRMLMENGHPGVEVNEAAIRKGESPYTKYYQQQGEQLLPPNGSVRPTISFVLFLYLSLSLSPSLPLSLLPIKRCSANKTLHRAVIAASSDQTLSTMKPSHQLKGHIHQ